MNDTNKGVNPFWTTSVYPNLLKHDLLSSMYTKSLNRTSAVAIDPSPVINTRVNVDVLKQRIIVQKKKDRLKRTIIFSTVCLSIGALSILAN